MRNSPGINLLPGFTIPQLDRIVKPCAGDQSTVWAEGDVVDLFLMTSQTGDGLLDAISGVVDVLRGP